MIIYPFKDKIGYVTNEVSTVKTIDSNTNLENRIKFVTDLAAISRGKDSSNNPEARYKRLVEEAATNPKHLEDDILVLVTEVDRESETIELLINKDYIHNIGYENTFNRNRDKDVYTGNGYLIDSRHILYDMILDKVTNSNDNFIVLKRYHLLDICPYKFKFKSKASRPMEFIPVVIDIDTPDYYKDEPQKYHIYFNINFTLSLDLEEFVEFTKFGYLVKTEYRKYKLYTNLRNVYNYIKEFKKDSLECLSYIPFNKQEDLKHFRALKLKLPMYIWAQLVTHTQISTESQSDRVSEQVDYWLPGDLEDKLENFNHSSITDSELYTTLEKLKKSDNIRKYFLHSMLNTWSQTFTQKLLKTIGYKREIYSRAPYYFKYKEFVMTGWFNDPAVWSHFLLEREAYRDVHKSWVQAETVNVVNAIKKCLIEE